jgi:hypothetical protein
MRGMILSRTLIPLMKTSPVVFLINGHTHREAQAGWDYVQLVKPPPECDAVRIDSQRGGGRDYTVICTILSSRRS